MVTNLNHLPSLKHIPGIFVYGQSIQLILSICLTFRVVSVKNVGDESNHNSSCILPANIIIFHTTHIQAVWFNYLVVLRDNDRMVVCK